VASFAPHGDGQVGTALMKLCRRASSFTNCLLPRSVAAGQFRSAEAGFQAAGDSLGSNLANGIGQSPASRLLTSVATCDVTE
jgi:hypothetical protein